MPRKPIVSNEETAPKDAKSDLLFQLSPELIQRLKETMEGYNRWMQEMRTECGANLESENGHTDWREFQILALRAGVSIDDFWNLTPGEIALHIEAARRGPLPPMRADKMRPGFRKATSAEQVEVVQAVEAESTIHRKFIAAELAAAKGMKDSTARQRVGRAIKNGILKLREGGFVARAEMDDWIEREPRTRRYVRDIL